MFHRNPSDTKLAVVKHYLYNKLYDLGYLYRWIVAKISAAPTSGHALPYPTLRSKAIILEAYVHVLIFVHRLESKNHLELARP